MELTPTAYRTVRFLAFPLDYVKRVVKAVAFSRDDISGLARSLVVFNADLENLRSERNDALRETRIQRQSINRFERMQSRSRIKIEHEWSIVKRT